MLVALYHILERENRRGNMLDDLKYIHQKDVHDALGVVEKQLDQLVHEYRVMLRDYQPVENVVVAGMGGSALAAQFVPTWPALSVPYEIVRDYHIPAYVGSKTLFIASSYSGNTEETLAALAEAEAKHAYIMVITSGGKLAETARVKNYPYFVIPSGLQPRMAVFYNFVALIELFEAMRLIPANSKVELAKARDYLARHVKDWRADVPTSQNRAKQLALDLVGKSPVIYAGHNLFPAAYKWKININENAKNVAWCNQYPEFNHNEFIGWSSHPIDKVYAVINLRSSFDNPRIARRMDISKKLLGGRMPEPMEILAEGHTLLEQLLWVVMLGDFVSVYLALLNGLDPLPVQLVEKLKSDLQHD